MNVCGKCAYAMLNCANINGCWAKLPSIRTQKERHITAETHCVNGLFVSNDAGKDFARQVRIDLTLKSEGM